jgi:hypothetical protein
MPEQHPHQESRVIALAATQVNSFSWELAFLAAAMLNGMAFIHLF